VVAELRGIEWYETVPLEQLSPSPLEPFSFQVVLRVGAAGRPGDDLFIVDVCNPLWIQRECAFRGAIIGATRVIVDTFALASFQALATRYCSSCVGDTWDEVALRVARLGRWECEDYNAGVDMTD
jgi:hypothetical protein